MLTYERLFGSGPRGGLMSTILLVLAYYLEDRVGLPEILKNYEIRYSVFIGFIILGIALIIWSLVSLPLKARGRKLVRTGAFHFFRHPLYAAFLLFSNVGIAFLLNNWIYMIWVLILFPLWSLNVRSEEILMRKAFGEEYEAYCRTTWRFVPKLW